MSERTLLLNPGPVTLSPGVRAALQREDMCHREPEFATLTRSIIERLQRVYPAPDHSAVLLTGSGSCAVEAMLNTLAPRDGCTLVVANGVYGERMTAMLRAAGRPLRELRGPWPQAMDLATVERELQQNPAITHVAAVHNETTTGRLNDIPALAQLCRRYQKELLVDAVSSFGGEVMDFEGWAPLAVAATANKCLHGIPGMAFVMVRTRTLEQGRSQANTLYLDLFRYYREQLNGFSPFTQAVQAAFALDAALDELQQAGGWTGRHARYTQLSGRLREALPALGIPLFLPAADSCSMITAFALPQGWDYESLHDVLREAGFVIYAGQGDLKKTLFRIANMGDIGDGDWARLLAVFRDRVVGGRG